MTKLQNNCRPCTSHSTSNSSHRPKTIYIPWRMLVATAIVNHIAVWFVFASGEQIRLVEIQTLQLFHINQSDMKHLNCAFFRRHWSNSLRLEHRWKGLCGLASRNFWGSILVIVTQRHGWEGVSKNGQKNATYFVTGPEALNIKTLATRGHSYE